MLFSEPKIPQSNSPRVGASARWVSVLFSEPKIPQYTTAVAATCAASVSVLFSEPKIPQSAARASSVNSSSSFSALQRAENSSI